MVSARLKPGWLHELDQSSAALCMLLGRPTHICQVWNESILGRSSFEIKVVGVRMKQPGIGKSVDCLQNDFSFDAFLPSRFGGTSSNPVT